MAIEKPSYPGEKHLAKFSAGDVIMTKSEDLLNWAKGSSLWPLTFGLSCCAIEMMATGAPKFDIDRIGSGVFRASPRQCDVMIVAGTICVKMGDCMKKLYAQMPDPKYVIAMGNCAIGGGIFYHDTYSVVQGTEQLGIPVDIHVVGCPPRPEGLLNGILLLKKKIQDRGSLPVNLPKEIITPQNTQGLMQEKLKHAADTINPHSMLSQSKTAEAKPTTNSEDKTPPHGPSPNLPIS